MKFKSGSYSSELERPVKLRASVEIKDNQIIDVKISSGEGERNIEPELETEFKGQIISAQSVNIDGISSVSILTKAVKSVVGNALVQAVIDNKKDC